jgi:hypothetical protein
VVLAMDNEHPHRACFLRHGAYQHFYLRMRRIFRF